MARMGGVLLPFAILLLTVTAAAAAGPDKPPKPDANKPPKAEVSPPLPPSPPTTAPPTPGKSGDAPGHSGEAPGKSGEAPGHSGDSPGHSGEAPGHATKSPPPPSGPAAATPPPTPYSSPPPPAHTPSPPPPTPEMPPPPPPPGHTPETSTPPPMLETPPPAPPLGHAPETPPPTPETPPPTPETPPTPEIDPPPTPETPPPTPETPPPTPETPPSTPETSPPPPGQTPKPMKVKCHAPRKLYPNCPSKMMECPDDCSQSCFADCNLCKPVCVCSVPGACGDPRFIGGDGNSFYFHGRKDADFCVLSDRDLHINAHFIGKRGADMSRDFTWIQAVAVLFDGHSLYVGAKKTAKWDDSVDRLELTLDGEPVHIPEDLTDTTWTSRRVPTLSVTRTKAANGVLLVLDGRFSVRANVVPITEQDSMVYHYGKTAEDSLAHLELAFKFDALTEDVHGVVGQTYRSDYVNRFDVKATMPTMGGKDNFATSSLFAPDCAVARFGVSRGNVGATVMSELAGVSCASGMGGQGVVCKK